ncbi:hypothetical protein COLO4_24901 [Corchorus olitorius]|uniref:Aspartic peptidase n=1 Tax=Corchorus olitorius TaxID=93759 RepID=A0A1R3I5Z5_9ROSI|nr:hypothetical protein COLO4_24901 [Corchorus olitorius]
MGTPLTSGMKLICTIKGHSFTVLIDSGSTHNLVQPRVVRYLGLSIKPAPPITVRVGNGVTLHYNGMLEFYEANNHYKPKLSPVHNYID